MHIVIFGLSVSSAWGNGHATLWRGLIAALDAAGHEVVFFERDVPYYRDHRDLGDLGGLGARARLWLYRCWDDARGGAAAALARADAAIVTSYCPDGRAAAELVLASRALRVFYDLDTPVTLSRLAAGEDVPYVPAGGLAGFDLVLSYTGGRALDLLRDRLGARRVAALYGSVDPARHHPVAAVPAWAAACCYLGTWSPDRQPALEALFLEPARRHAGRFLLAGSMYPPDLRWPPNVEWIEHVAPAAHPAFYCSSPLTASVTRAPMAALGYCPSGRLFEAAACGVPVLSDAWPGLDTFFAPGDEILIAASTDDALAILALPRDTLARIGRRARARALEQHSSARRAAELVVLLEASPPRAIDPTGEDPRPAGRAVGVPSPHDPTGEDPRPAGRAVGVPSPRDPTGEDPRPAGRAVGVPSPRDPASPPTGEDPRPAGRAVGVPSPRDPASPIGAAS